MAGEGALGGVERPRRVGVGAATALVVGSMVGTGVFTTTGFLVEALRSPGAVLLVWVGGGLLALCGALAYAELSAAVPRNGGEYALLGRAYHPAVGFAAGVISIVVGFAAPLAASALAFGRYLAAALPGVAPLPAAVAVILAFAALHGADVTWGSRGQSLVAAAQVALLAAFAVAGLAAGDPTRLVGAAAPPPGAAAAPGFAIGLVLVTFAYSGWNGATYVAGEVREPGRTIPLALLLGTSAVTVLYVALNAAFLSAAPAADLSGVVEIGHEAARRLFGDGAARVLSAAIAVALASSVGAMLMAGSRVCDALGGDHPALAVLARRGARRGPAAAIAVLSALALAMVATSSFAGLLAYIGFTLSLSAGLTVLGVVVLRLREPRLARPYRAWGYPVTPAAFVALSAWMVGRAVVERPASALAGLGTVAAALALRAWLVRGKT